MQIMMDTNILTRTRDADSADHAACVQALATLNAREDEPCFCAQVSIEYWTVATRPREVNGLGLTPAEAQKDLEEFDEALVLLPEPPDMAVRWRVLAAKYEVRGKQAHDTRLAALMLAHGITHLLTLNPKDFARYEGIVCISPFSLAAKATEAKEDATEEEPEG